MLIEYKIEQVGAMSSIYKLCCVVYTQAAVLQTEEMRHFYSFYTCVVRPVGCIQHGWA